MVVTWNRCFSWYLLAVFAVLYFVGKNNLAVTPFGFISELLCLLCYGTVCLLDFVFLEFFSLTLLFFLLFVCPWASFMLGKCCITGPSLQHVLYL